MKYIHKALWMLLAIFNFCQADVAGGVLEKYKQNNVFVCVGIYSCVNLARAFNANYRTVHGIDEDEVLVKHARTIFPHDINENRFRITDYHIHDGDLETFEQIINSISAPMTIFLGNHCPEYDKPVYNNVLEQLDVIKRHPLNNHVVCIDYIHHAGTPAFGNITLEQIKAKLHEINPDYRCAFEQGGIVESEKNAILVAYIP